MYRNGRRAEYGSAMGDNGSREVVREKGGHIYPSQFTVSLIKCLESLILARPRKLDWKRVDLPLAHFPSTHSCHRHSHHQLALDAVEVPFHS